LPPTQYRALRHLDARSERLGASGWMDAWTEVAAGSGFRFQIVGEGGSGFIRSHVLRPWLAHEEKMWAAGDPGRAAWTSDNYVFEERGAGPDSLVAFAVRPRRKDMLLVTGSIFVEPDAADLMRVEGRLSKTPSFMTRQVDVVRRYRRINGVRVPISIDSVAQVLIAGRSTFQMTYEYETINGQHVGTPRARTTSNW
jgi:hypothetical protein